MNLRNEFVFQKIEILDESKGEKNKIKFCWCVADAKNANNRIYPQAVLEKEVDRLQAVLGSGDPMWGGDGHPQGSSRLSKVGDISHQILRVWMDGKKAMAEAEIVPTKIGKDLSVVLGHGKIGASLRGTGSTSPKDGVEFVGEDFRCEGIDFLLSPSFLECQVGGLYESAEFPVEKINEAEEMEMDELDEEFLDVERKRLLQSLVSQELGSNVFIRSIEENKLLLMTTDKEGDGTLRDSYFELPYSFDDKISEFVFEVGEMKKIEKENPVVEARADLKFGSLSENEMKISGAKENFGPEKIIVLNEIEKRFISPGLAKILREQKYKK